MKFLHLTYKYLVPFLLGSCSILAFSPFNFYPLIFFTIISLLYITNSNGSENIKSFLYGSGFFIFGIYWIYICLQKFGGMPSLMAVFSTLALCLYLALFFLPFSLFKRYKNTIYFIPAFFTLIELLRSTAFTGFPWLSLGYTQVPHSPLTGYLPIIGIHGISFLVVLSSVLFFKFFKKDSAKVLLLTVLISIWVGGQYLKGIKWTKPKGDPFSISLIQGNISQDKKWDKSMINASLDHYQKLILSSDSSLIILPETSMPILFKDLPQKFLQNIEDHTFHNKSNVILGAIESSNHGFYNSAFLIGSEQAQTYRKEHLVPFGEFIPFENYLGYFYENWLHIPFNSLQRGLSSNAPKFWVNDTSIAVNICYEDVFGSEIIKRYDGKVSLPNLYVNISNDAWYGKSIAAQQHLQISQARSIETGKMMVRATNTGVTAFIDVDGKILKELPQFVSGILTQTVQGYEGRTPYTFFTNIPIFIISISILLFYFLRSLFHFHKKKIK